jgi:hypothetical protein
LYSLRALLTALAPLVGAEAELENRAISAGWAREAEKDKINEWSSKGIAFVEEELKTLFQREYEAEYNERMRRVCPLQVDPNLHGSYVYHLSDLGLGVLRIRMMRSWSNLC